MRSKEGERKNSAGRLLLTFSQTNSLAPSQRLERGTAQREGREGEKNN